MDKYHYQAILMQIDFEKSSLSSCVRAKMYDYARKHLARLRHLVAVRRYVEAGGVDLYRFMPFSSPELNFV